MTSTISALSELANDSTLVDAGTITHTEHNTHRTNYRTEINSHREVFIQLEKHYASASEPTDKPAGKLWFDSGNTILKLYVDGAGTLRTIPRGSGVHNIILTTTAATNVTLPTTGTLATLAGTETLSAKTLTAPDINGGTADALTSLGIRSTGTGAFDLVIANSENLTSNVTLTLTLTNANRTMNLGGHLTLAAAFTTSGANALTLTTTAATNVTLPTTGTLATLAGTETLSAKTLASPVLSGTVTGTYTLGGTPTLSVTVAGTPTFSGITTFSSATASTSISTGAVVLSGAAGGLGVAGAAWIGGLLNVAGAVTLQGTLNVGGATAAQAPIALRGARWAPAAGYHGVASIISSDALGANIGPGLIFSGVYTGTSVTELAQVAGLKANATDGNYDGALAFYVRANGGGTLTEGARLDAGGNLLHGTTTTPTSLAGGLAMLLGTDATASPTNTWAVWGKDEAAGATWPYVRAEDGSVGFIPLANEGLLCKVIEIGAWNMDTTASVSVAHGLTITKIRSVTAMIIDDLNAGAYILPGIRGSATDDNVYIDIVDATNITLNRLTGGLFDGNVNYDGIANRGWITVWYTN